MNIALTGATGSIGTELKPFLEGLGHSVFTISSSLPSDNSSIFSYEDLSQRKISCKIDYFIHLASLNSNLTENNIKSEVALTELVLNSLEGLGCSKLIFFSTAKVYGDNSFIKEIFTESSGAQPQCPYSKAKKICEDLILTKSIELKIEATIFRLPPVLNQSDGSNLGKLIRLVESGFPVPSFPIGNFNQRSFISFINIQEVFSALLGDAGISLGQIYNLADDGDIALNSLLRLHGKKSIIAIPQFIETLIFKISFLQGILLKLYGNFILDNRQLKHDLGVKLYSTEHAVLSKNKSSK